MSLRLRIVMLVLLAALGPAAVLTLHLVRSQDAEINQAKRTLNDLSAHAVDGLSDRIRGATQLLHGLSRASDLDGSDKAGCSKFLNQVLARYPQFTGLLTIRPDGQLQCDSLQTGRILDLNDRAYFKKARTSVEPVYEPVFGRLTGVPVLQVAFPVRDRQGELRFVLLASLNLAAFAADFADANARPGLEMLIWDGAGTLMASAPGAASTKLLGTVPAKSAVYGFVAAPDVHETAELPGPDGATRIWAGSSLRLDNAAALHVTLGIPRTVLLAKADRDLRNTFTVLAGVTVLAILAALLFAELGIRRHLARIMNAAQRQGAGDASARIGAPFPRGELGGLMVALNATAAAVETQQAEIGRKSEELRRTNRTLRVLSAVNSSIVRIHERHALLIEACRIAEVDGEFPIAWAGLVDRDAGSVVPVAWAGVDSTFVESIPRAIGEPGGIVGLAIRDRVPVVVNDISTDPRMSVPEPALALGTRALVIFPLLVGGEATGVLVLHARESGFFDAAEMKLLTELAGDVAFALEYIAKSEKLDFLAYYDALTGLANRTLFNERLTQSISVNAREGRKLALALIDIERFRTINATFGRVAGDTLLQQFASRLIHEISDSRCLARLGADHFAWVIPDEAELEGVARRIERLSRDVFGAPVQIAGTELRVAARFGVALFPDDGVDPDALFRNAEAALKRAKRGGEQYLFYDPKMTERVAERLTLESKLRLALANSEFVLHYQPKLDLQTRHIVGVEALIRWQSPESGLMPPMTFIPLLEETGLILQVGAWAMKQAARDHREWVRAGVAAPRVAVNVSPIQLRQREFVRSVEQAIREDSSPTGIDLEITETVIMEDVAGTIVKLQAVRDLGVSIAIDDFGVGYSSLAYLAKLPVQTLKIDGSFIITMLDDPDTMTMVSTIISLAHSLRLTVIAEGVESEAQAKVLSLLRCDGAQGYLFSRPVPKDALLTLLREAA